MTTTRTPAETLRAAATRLREMADWLDATADLIDSEPTRPVTPKRPALDLAQLILGGG